ncbi:MAG TPA: hypothetical protein VJQ09_05955, partial [Candidatus Limnocylindria bacterium]|nr:hypothetical protein [Candidatus Limnocylindria bacterium]
MARRRRAVAKQEREDAVLSAPWLDAIVALVIVQVVIAVLYFDRTTYEVFDQPKAIVAHAASWV